MEIIDQNDHNLTNFSSKSRTVSSDHIPLLMEVKLEARPTVQEKVEVPNFNDNSSLLKLKEITSKTTQFTECFANCLPLMEQSKNWLSTVETHVKNSFKKIRIRPTKIRPSAADRLISQKNKLLKQGKITEAKTLDAQIAIQISEEGRTKANMFKKYTDTNGSIVLSEMWKLKKRLFPKKASMLPSAKVNYKGKLVTEPRELTKLIGEEYGRVRLRNRPSHPMNHGGKEIRQTFLN